VYSEDEDSQDEDVCESDEEGRQIEVGGAILVQKYKC
jgi:hypothetical protein